MRGVLLNSFLAPWVFLKNLAYSCFSFDFIFTVLWCLVFLSIFISWFKNPLYKILNLILLSMSMVFLWGFYLDFTFILLSYIIAFTSAIVMLFLTVVLMLPISYQQNCSIVFYTFFFARQSADKEGLSPAGITSWFFYSENNAFIGSSFDFLSASACRLYLILFLFSIFIVLSQVVSDLTTRPPISSFRFFKTPTSSQIYNFFFGFRLKVPLRRDSRGAAHGWTLFSTCNNADAVNVATWAEQKNNLFMFGDSPNKSNSACFSKSMSVKLTAYQKMHTGSFSEAVFGGVLHFFCDTVLLFIAVLDGYCFSSSRGRHVFLLKKLHQIQSYGWFLPYLRWVEKLYKEACARWDYLRLFYPTKNSGWRTPFVSIRSHQSIDFFYLKLPHWSPYFVFVNILNLCRQIAGDLFKQISSYCFGYYKLKFFAEWSAQSFLVFVIYFTLVPFWLISGFTVGRDYVPSPDNSGA